MFAHPATSRAQPGWAGGYPHFLGASLWTRAGQARQPIDSKDFFAFDRHQHRRHPASLPLCSATGYPHILVASLWTNAWQAIQVTDSQRDFPSGQQMGKARALQGKRRRERRRADPANEACPGRDGRTPRRAPAGWHPPGREDRGFHHVCVLPGYDATVRPGREA